MEYEIDDYVEIKSPYWGIARIIGINECIMKNGAYYEICVKYLTGTKNFKYLYTDSINKKLGAAKILFGENK